MSLTIQCLGALAFSILLAEYSLKKKKIHQILEEYFLIVFLYSLNFLWIFSNSNIYNHNNFYVY